MGRAGPSCQSFSVGHYSAVISYAFTAINAHPDLIFLLLASFFPLYSVGSMLALDRPFVTSSVDTTMDTCGEICLEYGSATQLYLVPFMQHEEQVCHGVSYARNHLISEELTSLFLRYL